MRTHSRTITLALAGLGLALLPITSASAAAGGNRTPIDAQGDFQLHDLCPFQVDLHAHVVGDETAVDTGTGSIVRDHLNETDVYSAHGKSLEGHYTFEIQVTKDAAGNVIKGFQTGVIVRVPLPNGDMFQVTGRADSLNAQTDFISAPTHGVTRNLDEFCAALG